MSCIVPLCDGLEGSTCSNVSEEQIWGWRRYIGCLKQLEVTFSTDLSKVGIYSKSYIAFLVDKRCG